MNKQTQHFLDEIAHGMNTMFRDEWVSFNEDASGPDDDSDDDKNINIRK